MIVIYIKKENEMKKIMRLLMLSSSALLFTACGGEQTTCCRAPDGPEITSIEIKVDSVDYSNNTGIVLSLTSSMHHKSS